MKNIINFIIKQKFFFNIFISVLIFIFLLLNIFFSITNKLSIQKERYFIKNISNIIWKFGRTDGSVISERIRFLPDKKISGYISNNEVYWGVKNNQYLVFYNRNYEETTVFTEISKIGNKWYLSGKFLYDNSITHTLKEVDRVSSQNEKILFLFFLIFLLIFIIFNIKFLIRKINFIFNYFICDKNYKILAIITVISGIIFILVTIIIIPPNMDEFLPYHQLARFFFPDSKEHIFREPADDSFDIKIFGIKLPLKSYYYVGFSEALRYLPFYLVSRTYYSARIMKLILILILLFCIWKLTKIPLYLASLLVFFNLPLVFQMIVDTGPVAYQLMLSLLTPYLIYKTKNLFVAILIGILLYFGIELKTIFIYFLLPICLFSLVLIIPEFMKESFKEKIKRIIFLCVIIITFSFFSLITFTGTTKYGQVYYKDLIQNRQNIPILNIDEQLSHFKNSLSIYFETFLNFGHRVYGYHNEGKIITNFIYLNILILFYFSIYIFFNNRNINFYIFYKRNNFFINDFYRRRLFIIKNKFFRFIKENTDKKIIKYFILFILSLLSFLFITFNIIRLPDSWAAHHIILGFSFLLLSIGFAIKIIYLYFPKAGFCLVFLLFIFNLLLFINLLSKEPLPTDDRSKIQILNYLNNKQLSKNNIYVVIDWGIYYILSIYGPKDQIVLYIDPLNNNYQIEQIKNIAIRKQRNIIFIKQKLNDNGLSIIKNNFSNITQIITDKILSQDIWQIWQVKL